LLAVVSADHAPRTERLVLGSDGIFAVSGHDLSSVMGGKRLVNLRPDVKSSSVPQPAAKQPTLDGVLRYLRPVGGSLAGISLATAGAYLVAAVTSGHRQPWWPYVLLLGLTALGGILYLIGQRASRTPGLGSSSADIAVAEDATPTQAPTHWAESDSQRSDAEEGQRRHKYGMTSLQATTAGAEQPSSGCHDSPTDLIAAITYIPFAPPVELVLHAASARAEFNGRRFLTADVLLAILDLPDSAVEKCLECFSQGLADQVRLRLRNALESATKRSDYPKWRPFNLDLRPEVLRARELAAEGKDPEVTELHLLLGILDNERSGTRRELTNLLSSEGRNRLRNITARMLTEPVTPGSKTEKSS